MKKKIFLWILVISWMALIFYFSAQNAESSTNQSRAIVDKTIVVDKYSENKSEEEKEELRESIDRVLRKVAHASVFFVLAILVWFLVKEYTLDIKKILLIGIIICFLYSCSDEIHQLYVIGRSGEVRDVIIDNIGACFGYLVFYLSGRKIWKKSN